MSWWRRITRRLWSKPHPRVPMQLATTGPFKRGDLLIWTSRTSPQVAHRTVTRWRERPAPRPTMAFRHVRPITDDGTRLHLERPGAT